MKKQPWMKFYPSDWRADASLRMCSPAARLLWLEMLCLMHEAEPRGHLLVKGRRPSDIQLGMLSGITDGSVPVLLSELREAEVFDEVDGVIISRKMVRDTKVSKDQSDRRTKGWEAVQSGRTGGKTQIEPQIPDTRSQIDTTPTPRENAEDDWPEGKSLDHARALCDAVGAAGKLDTARSPGLIQSLGRLAAWRREGASWEHDVIPTVTALAQKAKGTVSTWTYFDAAIGESIAANRRALDIPEHTDVQRTDTGRPQNPHDARRAAHLELLAEQGDDQREDQGWSTDGR